jgi:protein O-GlcNAc transferase
MGPSDPQLDPAMASPMSELAEDEAVGVVNALLETGNLPLANYLVRDALDVHPGSAALRYLLAAIAGAVGRLEDSRRFLREVLAMSPGFEAARQELEAIEEESTSSQTSEPSAGRFLLIRAWGFGFWSDVSHVLSQLLLAEITNRVPVVHWGTESLFSDGKGDAFRRFFNPVSAVVLDDLRTIEGGFFPPKWDRDSISGPGLHKFDGEWSRMDAIYFLNRPEAVLVADFFTGVAGLLPWLPEGHPSSGRTPVDVMRGLAATYLQPSPPVVERVGAFERARLAGRRWVAVHMRGSDKVLESDELARVNEEIMLETDRLVEREHDLAILLLTDDSRLVERASTRWGSRMVTTDVSRTSSRIGVHYLKDADPITLGREVLVDALVATRCEWFIGNGQSNVAAMIECLKEWPAGRCTLVRPSLFARPNLFLHFDTSR